MIFGILHSWSFRIEIASVVKIVMTTSVEVLFYITGFIALNMNVFMPRHRKCGELCYTLRFSFQYENGYLYAKIIITRAVNVLMT